jgi:hypothetical protein
VFVTRDTVVIRDARCSKNLFINWIVRDPRRSWTKVCILIYLREIPNQPFFKAKNIIKMD